MGGLQAQGLFAQAKHEVDVLVHRGRLDHAVAALVQGNGLRITVAGVGPSELADERGRTAAQGRKVALVGRSVAEGGRYLDTHGLEAIENFGPLGGRKLAAISE